MYCLVSSYLTNSIPASNVQFRAGSSFIGSGGTLHPAAQIIVNPLYDYNTFDFDVAVVRVSGNVYANLIF
jgi:DeoR/GlpR family transcriptional regulator of sugar metabolism